jgi:hypothetical protein
LPSFGTTDSTYATAAEANLIIRYIQKNDRFRKKSSPFPLPDKAIFNAYWPEVVALQPNLLASAKLNAVSFFGNWPGKLIVGEPFRRTVPYRQVATPALWGFAGGNGQDNGIYNKEMISNLFTTDILAANPEAQMRVIAISDGILSEVNEGMGYCLV